MDGSSAVRVVALLVVHRARWVASRTRGTGAGSPNGAAAFRGCMRTVVGDRASGRKHRRAPVLLPLARGKTAARRRRNIPCRCMHGTRQSADRHSLDGRRTRHCRSRSTHRLRRATVGLALRRGTAPSRPRMLSRRRLRCAAAGVRRDVGRQRYGAPMMAARTSAIRASRRDPSHHARHRRASSARGPSIRPSFP